MATIDQKSGVFAGLAAEEIPAAGSLALGKPKNFVAMQWGEGTPPAPPILECLDTWYTFETVPASDWLENAVIKEVLSQSGFVAPDGTGLTSYVPEVGPAWSLISGTVPTIQSNHLEGAGESVSFVDTAVDVTITCEVTVRGVGGDEGILIGVRAPSGTTNESFYVWVRSDFASFYQISNVGQATEIGSRWITSHLDITRTVRIDCYKDGMVAYLDGWELHSYKRDYYNEADHTNVYISFNGTTGEVDNFLVKDVLMDLRTGSNSQTTPTGIVGNAMFCDNINTRIESRTPIHPLCYGYKGNGSWSVSWWANSSDNLSGNGHKANIGCGNFTSGFHFQNLSGTQRLQFHGEAGGTLDVSDISAEGTYYHLVIVYDDVAETATLYRDTVVMGVLDFSATNMPLEITDISNSFNIGWWFASDPRYFDGRLDEVATWCRALTTDDIEALYNNGNGTTYTDFLP